MLREPRPNPKAEQPAAPKSSRFRVVKLEDRIAPATFNLGPYYQNYYFSNFPRYGKSYRR
jgi:hypothetical protein